MSHSGHPDALDLIRYLRANRDGLADYRLAEGFSDPTLRGLGAAEGNVDKVVANRHGPGHQSLAQCSQHRQCRSPFR